MRNLSKIISCLLVLSFVFVFLPINMSVGYAASTGKLVAHYKFDGDFKDYSGNGNDGTTAGGAIPFVDGKVGKAAKFNGSTYIEVPDSDSLDLDKSFTFSAWIYKGTYNQDENAPILQKLGDESINDSTPYSLLDNRYYPYMKLTDSDAAEGSYWCDSKKVDIQRWTLLTATWNGNTIKYYIDGVLSDSEVFRSTLPYSGSNLIIGAFISTNGSQYLNGVIDDLRIYDYALADNDIKALFDAAKGNNPVVSDNPAISGNKKNMLVAHYKFDEDYKDYSGCNNNGTVVGGSIPFVDAKAGKGAKFDGATYIEVEDSDYLDLDTGFTLSLWLYKDAYDSDELAPILKKLGDESINDNAPYSLLDHGYYPYMKLTSWSEITENSYWCDSQKVDIQKWTYLSSTWNGNTVKYYINGALVDSETFKDTLPHSSMKLNIGADISSSGSKYFKGIMDDLRIYNYALGDSEIKTLYNSTNGTATTTPASDQTSTSQDNVNGISLKVAEVSNGFVDIVWTVPSSLTTGLTGYYVYRGSEPGKQDFTTPTLDFPLTEARYVDTKIEKDKTYYYVVKAVYEKGKESQPSNEVSATTSGQNVLALQVGNPNIIVNSVTKQIDSTGTCPLVVDGRTLVPIRAIVEPMGGTASWDGNEKKITINVKDTKIELWVDKTNAKVNGVVKALDIGPQIIKGRTMLPLRFIIQNIPGCKVNWYGPTKSVTIQY
ncbi:MAG TPA: LamG-like jellyroll fold domain-containing protein [Pseudobacteroides sp.]|uniref:LamG-like jellyroll fold domain-containing protein n=1 Tax=Pseudobacteroides sp. TaxID=1968840 RepID=UPI002F92F190